MGLLPQKTPLTVLNSPSDANGLSLAIDNTESKQKTLDSYMATATGERDLSESKPRTDLLTAYGEP